MEKRNNKILENWLQWFVGFIDADGSFQIFPKKRSYIKKNGQSSEYINIGYGFHIGLSINDKQLLIDIQKKLNNIGHIYEYPERNEIRLAITKLIELNYLIDNIFDKYPLLTDTQRKRYALLKKGVTNKINRVENMEEYFNFINDKESLIFSSMADADYYKSSVFYNWLIGFINGEGSFTIHKKGHLVFYIEHSDKFVLEKIREVLNLGPKIIDRGTRNNTRLNTYCLNFSSKKDLLTLRNICDDVNLHHLEGCKLEQYKKWIRK
jgi:hypothetical protein